MYYIITWAIISYTGDCRYANPEYNYTMCKDYELAETVDYIKKKGYEVDIKVYKATPIEYELTYTENKKEIIEKIPHIKLKENKC